jgi:hypothetical protein
VKTETLYPRTGVESKLLKSIGYDADKKELHVEFGNGGIYTYHGVEPAVHADMMAAKSLGGHFLKHVKNAHEFTKR